MLNKIKSKGLKLFDVSLRDGLQSQTKIFSFKEKKDLFHKIISKYNPSSIEVGSIVSPKILPQMNNSLELYSEIKVASDSDLYLLIPSFKKYKKITEQDVVINNISLITSTSEKFLLKNTNKTEMETRNYIRNVIIHSKNYDVKNIKLYISCINNCPILGKLDNDYVVDSIFKYTIFSEINEICLSDTRGNLEFQDFKYIINRVMSRINPDRISLHLHVAPNNMYNLSKIIEYSISLGIIRFDVSCLENSGGCTVTMNKNMINSNLTYEQLESLL